MPVEAPHLEHAHDGGCQGRVAHGAQEEGVVEQHARQAEQGQRHRQPDTAQLGSCPGSCPRHQGRLPCEGHHLHVPCEVSYLQVSDFCRQGDHQSTALGMYGQKGMFNQFTSYRDSVAAQQQHSSNSKAQQ